MQHLATAAADVALLLLVYQDDGDDDDVKMNELFLELLNIQINCSVPQVIKMMVTSGALLGLYNY